MRTKRPLAALTPSLIMEVASHGAMGIALGLGFSFVLAHVAPLGVVALISQSAVPEDTMWMVMVTCVTTFGIGTTFTGIAFMTMKDRD